MGVNVGVVCRFPSVGEVEWKAKGCRRRDKTKIMHRCNHELDGT